jgi:hypothetical protein
MPKTDSDEHSTPRQVNSGDETASDTSKEQGRTVSDAEKSELIGDARDFMKRREKTFRLLSREGKSRPKPPVRGNEERD